MDGWTEEGGREGGRGEMRRGWQASAHVCICVRVRASETVLVRVGGCCSQACCLSLFVRMLDLSRSLSRSCSLALFLSPPAFLFSPILSLSLSSRLNPCFRNASVSITSPPLLPPCLCPHECAQARSGACYRAPTASTAPA